MGLEESVTLLVGDITDMEVDAIVNAANTQLVLGAGVAGAIRRKGGAAVEQECREHGPIGLGEVATTTAGEMKARYVIHAAGMELGGRVTAEVLERCVENVLDEAHRLGIKTIALPAIGTGVGGLETARCAETMCRVVASHLAAHDCPIERIYFVLFDRRTYDQFRIHWEKAVSSAAREDETHGGDC